VSFRRERTRDDNPRVNYPSEELVRNGFGVESDFAVLYASSVAGFPLLRALLSFLYLVVNDIPVVVINSCYQPLFSSLACHISSESCIVILAMTPSG